MTKGPPIRNGRSRGARFALGLVACLLLTRPEAVAREEAPRQDTPRIALVLSGGGALGLAHVGAIQEMEAMGLRPDLIVGTSMGAIIGGLYASGLSPGEIGDLVGEVDWSAIFSPQAQRDKLSYRQKQQQSDFPGTAGLGVSTNGIVLPTGVVPDQALMRELRKVTPERLRINDFDDLPIPFRAVATDISTGEAVLIEEGELPEAMRASMSVPGVFPAFPHNGRLLVDGGLSANIPVEAARSLGADIVIALWTPGPLLQTDEVRSVIDVLGQTVSLLILANEKAALAGMRSEDVLVTIDPGEISPAGFNRHQDLIEAGRQAVRERKALIAPLAASRPPLPTANADREPPVISFVHIENSSRLNQAILEARLKPLLGRAADPDRISDAIDEVYALGPFERVDYTLSRERDLTGLIVRAQDDLPDAGKVRLGLLVESDFEAGADTALSFDYRSPILDAYGSEIRAIASIGDMNEFGLEYLRFLDPGQDWFSLARTSIENRPVGIFDRGGFRQAGYDLTYGLLGLDLGRQIERFGEIRIGLETGRGRIKLNEGSSSLADEDFSIARVLASAGIDTVDDPFFPRRGIAASANWTRSLEDLGASDSSQTFSTSGLYAFSSGRHTLLASLAGGWRLAGEPSPDMIFRAGGLFSLSGYRRDELTGENYAIGRLMYRRVLGNDEPVLFGVPLFAGASLEAGDVWSQPETFSLNALELGGSLFIGAGTALGPVYLAFGRSESGRRSAYLVIGRSF